jgi:hypothetical protein
LQAGACHLFSRWFLARHLLGSSETSAVFQRTIRGYILEDRALQRNEQLIKIMNEKKSLLAPKECLHRKIVQKKKDTI